MTDTESPLSLRLLADLSAFLRNPVIKLQNSDDLVALQVQVSELQSENEDLRIQNEQLLAKYRDELYRAMALQDLCRIHGIKWR